MNYFLSFKYNSNISILHMVLYTPYYYDYLSELIDLTYEKFYYYTYLIQRGC